MMNSSLPRVLLVGSGGREAAVAWRLSHEAVLFAALSHLNPSMVDLIEKQGGAYTVCDVGDPKAVAKFAQIHGFGEEENDMAFVSADGPLAQGVVDELTRAGVRTVGGSKAATRIEWDKIYSMQVVAEVAPDITPFHRVIESESELDEALGEFQSKGYEVVIKPQGLTGGKGVKVMPEHLPSWEDAKKYALECLATREGEQVLLVEKCFGPEFTIMGFTDGENLKCAPPTYDYPYRFAGDSGPGTGGMGCITGPAGQLPFLSDDDIATCHRVMQATLTELKNRRTALCGVLNGGFFKTKDGIRFMEYNARLGDPEALNVMALLRTSMLSLIHDMYFGMDLSQPLRFDKRASVIKYLVAPEYPDAAAEASEFSLDYSAAEKAGVQITLATAERLDAERFITLKKIARRRVHRPCRHDRGGIRCPRRGDNRTEHSRSRTPY